MSYTVLVGDCRESLKTLQGLGVRAQTCVTSPPYYGLRDYGHDGQIGLEETPEQYIANLVEVFRCVRDVLADDGTLWVNIGDSYAGSGKGQWNGESSDPKNKKTQGMTLRTQKAHEVGCKPKDLIGIPWMLAFALRADGWYLRQDIIWHKSNPMPESVRDRCTKAHEYVFLLSKSQKYYFDHEAMKEPSVRPGDKQTFGGKKARENEIQEGDPRFRNGYEQWGRDHVQGDTRNRRSVWTIATRPYKGAHFATFPPALIEPCILAGSRPGDIVLDPFGGSGTTAGVAEAHGRHAILCELNQTYADLVPARVDDVRAYYQRNSNT